MAILEKTTPRNRQLARRSISKGAERTVPKPSGILTRAARKRPVIILKPKFKSKLEERINLQITEAGLDGHYEAKVLHYVVPARKAKYTPDFPIGDSASPIYIEAKGRFRSAAERQKLLLVRDQNPGVDIRLVFQNGDLPIYKGSPTSHAKWAADNGFQYADKGVIPPAWLKEAKT